MKLTFRDSGLTRKEWEVIQSLSTPVKIQDYLDQIPMNWETNGPTYQSPRRVLENNRAHCFEGALLAAAALWAHGERPRVVNLSPKMGLGDFDHVITLYERGGRLGAVSKTNHSVLRFRDPVYKNLRELVLSYFNEWFLPTGEKVLECYSRPLDLSRLGTGWLTTPDDLDSIADRLSELPHTYIVPKNNWRYLRRADSMEQKAASFAEWPNPGE